MNQTQIQVVPVAVRLLGREAQADYLRSCLEAMPNHVIRCGSASAILSPLEFDSDCFGVQMGHIHSASCHGDDAATLAGACADRAKNIGLSHLVIRIPASHVVLGQALAESGFFLVDTLATFLKIGLANSSRLNDRASLDIQPVIDADVPILIEQSESIYPQSRYFNDPTLSPEGAIRLFRRWVANDCSGRADIVLVAHLDGRVAGFVACTFQPQLPAYDLPASATIDLIAVFGNAQGRGIGSALVQAALAHYVGRADRMFVGTQGGNNAAMRLYQSARFRLAALDITYHWAQQR